MIYQYKYKFYLNASHSIKINNNKGQIHSHCFEIVLDIASTKDSFFVKFDEIEKRIDKILEKYQDSILNEIPPFDTINPTVENIGKYIKCIIASNLYEIGWIILTLEISETPSRAFIINVTEEMEDFLEDFKLDIDENEDIINSLTKDMSPKINEIVETKKKENFLFNSKKNLKKDKKFRKKEMNKRVEEFFLSPVDIFEKELLEIDFKNLKINSEDKFKDLIFIDLDKEFEEENKKDSTLDIDIKDEDDFEIKNPKNMFWDFDDLGVLNKYDI